MDLCDIFCLLFWLQKYTTSFLNSNGWRVRAVFVRPSLMLCSEDLLFLIAFIDQICVDVFQLIKIISGKRGVVTLGAGCVAAMR